MVPPPQDPAQDPFLGRVIGKVKLERLIGRGGMGSVYLGEHVTLQKRMAVKTLPISPTTSQTEISRFLREARTAARLDHPNVIQVFDVDREEGFYYLVMQYVAGKSLATRIKDEGPLPWREACRIAIEVSRGLEVAHRFDPPIIHRDIKPGNIMIAKDGSVKVLDFGLVRTLDSEEDLTTMGEVVGTAAYMAPENIERSDIDHRADLYSLGATLFMAITGKKPFEAESHIKILYHHVHTPPPRPSELVPGLPAEVEAAILKLLEKKPEDRFQSAGELALHLAAVLAGAGAEQPREEATETAPGSSPGAGTGTGTGTGKDERAEDSSASTQKPELLVGQMALAKGWITEIQLEEALEVQEKGEPRLPLGRALMKLGYLSAGQVRALMKSQGLEMAMPTRRQGLRVRDQLFGKITVILGFAKADAVNQALKEHVRRLQKGESIRLGEILIERKVLTPEQVVEALACQRKTIFQCSACKKHFNKKNLAPGDAVGCPHCGAKNALPDPGSLEATNRMDELEVRLRKLLRERKETAKADEEPEGAQGPSPGPSPGPSSGPSSGPSPGPSSGPGPSPGPSPSPGPGPTAPVAPASQEETAPTGPLLGNEVAKRQAAEVLSAAKKGPAPLALVAGEKGVGKTRFGWEIQRLEGAKTFAHIRMPAAEGKGPYEALGSVAVSLVQVAQSSFPDWIGQAGPLVTLAPALAAGEPHKDAAKLLDAFERFLRGLSERMPLALFFDDADRLPSESWAALSHLARRGIGGLAIFAAVRGESLPSGWKELEKEKKGVTIRLRPIPEGLLKPLVQQILGPPAVSEVLVREVAFITEGVPLFVGEFLKIGKRKGFVFPEGDRWSTDLDRRARYVEDSLPPELEEKLVATARSLPPSHQKALGLLAMMPGPASAGEIGIASPIPASQLSVVLADLVAKRLVVKRTIEKVALHALTAKRVREAFSGIFPQKEARAAHEKFARHLEKLAAEGKKVSAEALAHHFDGAGTLDRAAQYLLAAGEEALAAGRVQRAAELLLRAREDSDALVATGKGKKSFLGGLFAKGTDLTKVHGLLGDAYLRLGKNEEALASLQRAIAEGDPKKEPERLGVHRGLGTAYLKLGNYGEAEKHLAAAQAKGAASSPDIDCYLGQLHLARDRYDPAREVVERALASLGEKGDPELRALAHHELGRSLYLGGRWEDAHAHWTIEREILQQQGLEFHLPRNLAAVALYRLRRGRILGALELLERARLFAAKTENREIEPRIHHGFGAVYLVRDEVARAFLEFQHGLEKANELHQPDRTARLVQGLGLAYLAAGKIHEALDHCAKGQELFERLRFRRGLADNHHLRGRISMASGNGSMAEQHFGYALKEYKEIGTSWRLPPLYLSYHRLNRALGRKDQSEKFLKEAERIARSTDDRTSLSEVFRTHAEVFQERGDEEKSDEYLKRAVEALKET